MSDANARILAEIQLQREHSLLEGEGFASLVKGVVLPFVNELEIGRSSPQSRTRPKPSCADTVPVRLGCLQELCLTGANRLLHFLLLSWYTERCGEIDSLVFLWEVCAFRRLSSVPRNDLIRRAEEIYSRCIDPVCTTSVDLPLAMERFIRADLPIIEEKEEEDDDGRSPSAPPCRSHIVPDINLISPSEPPQDKKFDVPVSPRIRGRSRSPSPRRATVDDMPERVGAIPPTLPKEGKPLLQLFDDAYSYVMQRFRTRVFEPFQKSTVLPIVISRWQSVLAILESVEDNSTELSFVRSLISPSNSCVADAPVALMARLVSMSFDAKPGHVTRFEHALDVSYTIFKLISEFVLFVRLMGHWKSLESVSFWLDVDIASRYVASVGGRMDAVCGDMSQLFVRHYIESGSPMEVNIDDDTRRQILKQIKGDFVSFENHFGDAQTAIFHLMHNDSYQRFKRSTEYSLLETTLSSVLPRDHSNETVANFDPVTAKADEKIREKFGLPASEFILDSFPCTLVRPIPVTGRLYRTQRFLCFRASVFAFGVQEFAMLSDIRHVINADGDVAIIMDTGTEIRRMVLTDISDAGTVIADLEKHSLKCKAKYRGVITPIPSISDEDWTTFLSGAEHIRVRFKGGVVLEEDQASDGMYQVVRGTVKVEKKQKHVLMTRLGPADVFGEISMLVEGGVASATVTADEDNVEICYISRDLIQSLPDDAAVRLYRYLALLIGSRLRNRVSAIMDKGDPILPDTNVDTAEFQSVFQLTEVPLCAVSAVMSGRINRSGRLYLTSNHLCFEYRVFGIRSKEVVHLVDVASIVSGPSTLNIALESGRELSFSLQSQSTIEMVGRCWRASRRHVKRFGVSPLPLDKAAAQEPVPIDLSNHPLPKLGDNDLAFLVSVGRQFKFEAGKVILPFGVPERMLFRVISGAVVEHVVGDDSVTMLRSMHIHKGDWFGAFSVFEAETPSPTCIVAQSDVELLAIDSTTIHKLMEAQPGMSIRLTKFIASLLATQILRLEK